MVTMIKNKKQCGRSMIEMLGVLAIVGILSAGGIAGYSMAMQNHKTNALIEKVQLIAQQMRILYRGNYETNPRNALKSAGMINDFNNPFGGTLNVGTASDMGSSAERELFWIYTESANIPADTCVKILTSDWGGADVFRSLHIVNNGTSHFYAYKDNNWPISRDTAIAACQGGNVTVRWHFK